jgi:hypothetical protein
MVDEIYNEEFRKDTLQIILDNLKDLSLWSAYNQDKDADLIKQIKIAVEFLQKERT